MAELLSVAVGGKGDTPSAALRASKDPKPTAVNRPDITTRGWNPAATERCFGFIGGDAGDRGKEARRRSRAGVGYGRVLNMHTDRRCHCRGTDYL